MPLLLPPLRRLLPRHRFRRGAGRGPDGVRGNVADRSLELDVGRLGVGGRDACFSEGFLAVLPESLGGGFGRGEPAGKFLGFAGEP